MPLPKSDGIKKTPMKWWDEYRGKTFQDFTGICANKNAAITLMKDLNMATMTISMLAVMRIPLASSDDNVL